MSDFKLSAEQIDVAVKWWCERIAAPKFDNGASDPANQMAQMLGILLAFKHKPTEANVSAFDAALRASLASEDRNVRFGLHVDYHPDRLLAEAAKAAGIDESRFPWKTNMWFGDGGVQVRYGYGAPAVELLSAPHPK